MSVLPLPELTCTLFLHPGKPQGVLRLGNSDLFFCTSATKVAEQSHKPPLEGKGIEHNLTGNFGRTQTTNSVLGQGIHSAPIFSMILAVPGEQLYSHFSSLW